MRKNFKESKINLKSFTLTNQVINEIILEGIMEKIDNKYEVGDWLIYPKHGLGD